MKKIAMGFLVSPSRLEIGSQKKELTITNGPKSPAHIEIYPDDFESSILVQPASLDLAPNETAIVDVSATTKQKSVISTNLSIIANGSAESSVAVSTGIKIPVSTVGGPENFLLAKIDYGMEMWLAVVLAIVLLAGIRKFWRG